jgi:glycosyltransferase involved in cell wall biosynthesis
LPQSKNQSNLILITNHFPFGLAEAFLEREIDYLTAAFDKVIILSRDVTSKEPRTRNTKFLYERVNPESGAAEKLLAPWLYLKNLRQVLRCIRTETTFMRKKHGYFSFAMRKQMMHDLTKALITSHHILRLMKEHRLEGKVFLYSYWLTSSALATTFVNPANVIVKRFSRAHGGDVYEARHALKYLSFRRTLAQDLDRIFTISEDGRRHLLAFTGAAEEKITVSRLGTTLPQPAVSITDTGGSGPFVIVSCSFLVPVKRLSLLIDALALVSGMDIRWIHIGDGPLKNSLQEHAKKALGAKANITFEFRGSLPNEELMSFYKTRRVDLFVNTSLSEGIPVTIMEAQSFGIPVVAPAVGGVPEIISSDTGRLFAVDSPASEVARTIVEVLSLPEEARQRMRSNAFTNWERRYNAEKNFPTFVASIMSL